MQEFDLERFEYFLPEGLISQHPQKERSSSRLMVLDRNTGATAHCFFPDVLRFLRPGDCLVLNDSKVFPARLHGRKETGGQVECLLLHYPDEIAPGTSRAQALLRSSKPFRPGMRIVCGEDLFVTVRCLLGDGKAEVELTHTGPLSSALDRCGVVPLPPYIRRTPEAADRDRYQTVYASHTGSVAAPTAGLHFTKELLEAIGKAQVSIVRVTLHVGLGTFAPIRCRDVREHHIHAEWIRVPQETAETIAETRSRGGRVVAVGTTSVRAIEAAATEDGRVRPVEGTCTLYIVPGFRFRVVDAMVTNFHLPASSLLVLVCAFAGRERILAAYDEAIREGYRFYSYGDAMLIM
ncbi:MAG: tRNA preQ1(34) S-adenosylmethionine ribosyltransferase-isomerase QueA [Deltaproteobacteria bacterium]